MLLDRIEKAVRDLGLEGHAILVATSGGIDSTVLLHALNALADRFDLTLSLGHVNHSLRGDESEADVVALRELASRLGLHFEVERIDPATLRRDSSNRDRPTLQEAARYLRYLALARLAERAGCDRIATAHNLDDQAETVLMRLLRGTGPEGMGGIREWVSETGVVRPLLAVSRAAIEAYAEAHALQWREDSSNASDRYTRNRLRHHWLPALAEEFNPQLLRVLGNFAEAQRRETEWLEARVAEEAPKWLRIGPELVEIERGGWTQLPEALARRLVRLAVIAMGGGRDLSNVHLKRALSFLRMEDGDRNAATLELPGGLTITREASGYILRRSPVR